MIVAERKSIPELIDILAAHKNIWCWDAAPVLPLPGRRRT